MAEVRKRKSDVKEEPDNRPEGETEVIEDSEEDIAVAGDSSETLSGNEEDDVFSELKEQVYQEKLRNLNQKLKDLYDGVLPEFEKCQMKLDASYRQRLEINETWREYMLSVVDEEYGTEKRAVLKELEEKKRELKEALLADIEERRKQLENEQLMIAINGDHIDPKPLLPRKLRRRPNEPAPPVIPEKKKKQPQLQIHHMLDDKDIDNDLRLINKFKENAERRLFDDKVTSQSPIRKSAEIKDGKLMYEKRWFLRGQPVFIEGKTVTKFPGVISSIGTDGLCISKLNDSSYKLKVNLSQLIKGKITIKHRSF